MSSTDAVANLSNGLEPNDAFALVVQCADLTIRISPSNVVEEVVAAPSSKLGSLEQWIGQDLTEVISSESRPKLDLLFNDNAASPDSESIWRHLNFKLEDGSSLPLLLKYFSFSDVGNCIRLICARDLSPVQEMQQLLQKELISLEKEREELALFMAKIRLN